MVQCEMCGAETSSPKTIKVEGAKLDVCSDCTDFGTEVKQPSSSSSSTKYSTGSSSSSSSGGGQSSGSTSSSSSGGSSQRRSDMFDDMDELATDYDDRVRNARESKGLSQSELANELNEKASLIRKIERGDTLPSDRVQSELESFLEINLNAEGASGEDSEWSGGSSTGSYTLGDVVKRKD
ncbi:TIGR00270 family protein [Natrinema pellirubrum DSM 15624]|uniref:TIGR00270 family protein n=3 Tax=Natrinema TaxID=88723 RepID=L0JKI0_NATP1|nr:multiprotein bridging factor aMBF1 [Natrinema thermotolerans]AGB32050.1 TIGR00270 family protein [Natrinema pellirubrum DSM 15624]QCC60643.1 TIGR00270 family protein [Natrinema thermotolerans]QCC61529.1 TIGR00270 family protein [Natrinema thermotolerans]